MSSPRQRQAHEAALQGRYSLVARRGNGTYGKVWEARHGSTGLKVAVKVIRPAKSDVPMAAVEREVRMMRLLRHHPHVVHLYEAAVSGAGDGRRAYLVMEYAEQGNLFDYVTNAEQGRLPEAEARRVFQQVAAGVAFCHRNRVLHRDVKMDNVVLDAAHNARVADFGFSKPFGARGRVLSTCRGSPDYAAPELCSGRERSYIGPEVDVWSCGVVLYAMLCGCFPFYGGDNLTVLQSSIRRGEFRLPSHLSDDARDLICGMLVVKPDKRMTMPEVLAHRWTQRDMPPYLSLPLPPAAGGGLQLRIHGAAVEEAARRGVDRDALLRALRDGRDDEATVAYQLILSNQVDAPTRYLWATARLHEQPPQWSLPGVDVGAACPHQTTRRIAAVAKDLGVLCTLLSHPPNSLLCASVLPLDAPPADAVFFQIQLYKAEAENNYMVDVKRVSGPQTHYLGICSQLASKLKQIFSP